MATFNARTLTASWRLLELVKAATDLSISIIAIQEHRRTCDLHIDIDDGWVFRATSASSRGVGGIGFLLSPDAQRALRSLEFPSDRIGRASFALADRRLHLFCVYAPIAPTTATDVNQTTHFYDQLGHKLDQQPSRDFHLILGDFNAPLPVDGRRVKNRCVLPNDNTPHLANFMATRDLLTANGRLR